MIMKVKEFFRVYDGEIVFSIIDDWAPISKSSYKEFLGEDELAKYNAIKECEIIKILNCSNYAVEVIVDLKSEQFEIMLKDLYE